MPFCVGLMGLQHTHTHAYDMTASGLAPALMITGVVGQLWMPITRGRSRTSSCTGTAAAPAARVRASIDWAAASAAVATRACASGVGTFLTIATARTSQHPHVPFRWRSGAFPHSQLEHKTGVREQHFDCFVFERS